MTPKVSILVPIYNVSHYIEKCARSIFNQTFTDIEYVFVNDATPDDSIEILQKIIEQYPNRKSQIKIIHHTTNKGLAEARNTAIDASTGKYISVIDSDDYVEPEMIEELYFAANNENADIVISDIIMEYNNRSVIKSDYLSKNSNEHFRDILKNEDSQSYLWNKLFRRTLLENAECRVPLGLNYLEDRHVIIRTFYYAKTIIKVNKPFYHYIQYNTNAITKTKTQMHFENTIEFWNLLDIFLIQHNEYEKHKQIIELSKIHSKLQLMIDTLSGELRKEYSKMFFDIELKYLSNFKVSQKLLLLFLHFRLFRLAQFLRYLLIIKNKRVK
ncbi:MAG: glycosyltransferase family 2 protein [Paludibacter sp.]